MKNNLKFSSFITFFLFLVMATSGSWAQGVGTTTADILKINQGARPAAMGGAYTAMGDDAYSVNYNPAGLAQIKATQIVLMHLDSLADISYEYLTFATAFGSDSAMAANITYRHMPTIDNGNGNAPVNSDDFLGTLSYALKCSSMFRIGLTVKYLNTDLASFSSSAVAFDLGGQLDKLPYGLRAGLAVQNLGTGMKFNPTGTTSDPLPMFIRVGLGDHQVIEGDRDLNVAVEIFKPSDQDIKMGIGGEFWLFPHLFAVRGGYKFESLGTPTGNVFDNYTLGCTLTRNMDGDDYSIDIAYDPASFGSTSSDTFFFGLDFKFNQFRIF